MAYVSIPKDLTKVKTKVALNLTKRQLIGFAIALGLGLPIFLFAKTYLPNDVSMLIMATVSFPIIFITLYEKDGLYAEKYLKYILERKSHPKIRIYKTACIYDMKAQGLKKEVRKNIGQKTKKAKTKTKEK